MLTRQGNASADTVRQAVGLRCRYLDSCESEKPSGCGRHTAYGLVRAYTGGRSTTGDGGGDNAYDGGGHICAYQAEYLSRLSSR
jgi:hypothetical protein